MVNDVVVYDVKKMQMIENIHFSEGAVCSRIYMCGFKIGSKLYSVGGMGATG